MHNSKVVSRKQQSNSMCFQICFMICDDWGIFSACAQFMEMMLFLISFTGCIVRNQIDANSGSSRNSRLYVPPAAHQHRVCSISLSSGEVNRIAFVLGASCTSQDIFATWWHSAFPWVLASHHMLAAFACLFLASARMFTSLFTKVPRVVLASAAN